MYNISLSLYIYIYNIYIYIYIYTLVLIIICEIPYPNTHDYAVDHRIAGIFHRRCVHARIQSPRVWRASNT